MISAQKIIRFGILFSWIGVVFAPSVASAGMTGADLSSRNYDTTRDTTFVPVKYKKENIVAWMPKEGPGVSGARADALCRKFGFLGAGTSDNGASLDSAFRTTEELMKRDRKHSSQAWYLDRDGSFIRIKPKVQKVTVEYYPERENGESYEMDAGFAFMESLSCRGTASVATSRGGMPAQQGGTPYQELAGQSVFRSGGQSLR